MPSAGTEVQLIGLNSTYGDGIQPVGIVTGSHCGSTTQVLFVVHFYNLCGFYRVPERGGLWHRQPAFGETPRQLRVTIRETCCALIPLKNT